MDEINLRLPRRIED